MSYGRGGSAASTATERKEKHNQQSFSDRRGSKQKNGSDEEGKHCSRKPPRQTLLAAGAKRLPEGRESDHGITLSPTEYARVCELLRRGYTTEAVRVEVLTASHGLDCTCEVCS